MSGTYLFAAPPLQVWQAIRNPAVLKACIPQCERIEPQRPDFWLGHALVRIGPLKVGFDGEITLSDEHPPERYTIAIKAKSWLGKPQGSAQVFLTALETGQTSLRYEAEVIIGIKLLDKAMDMAHSVAQELAEKFFSRLATEIVKS